MKAGVLAARVIGGSYRAGFVVRPGAS
jgi:hypothetical protein